MRKKTKLNTIKKLQQKLTSHHMLTNEIEILQISFFPFSLSSPRKLKLLKLKNQTLLKVFPKPLISKHIKRSRETVEREGDE